MYIISPRPYFQVGFTGGGLFGWFLESTTFLKLEVTQLTFKVRLELFQILTDYL